MKNNNRIHEGDKCIGCSLSTRWFVERFDGTYICQDCKTIYKKNDAGLYTKLTYEKVIDLENKFIMDELEIGALKGWIGNAQAKVRELIDITHNSRIKDGLELIECQLDIALEILKVE